MFLSVICKAFAELLEEGDVKIPGWFSFNSKDGVNVVSGDSIKECISIAENCEKVVAVGINCTPPRFIEGLVLDIEKVRLGMDPHSLGICIYRETLKGICIICR